MSVTILSAADAPKIQVTVDGLSPVPLDAARLFDPLPSGQRFIVIGDTALSPVPFCRLVHYQITSARQIALMPAGLATLLTASGGWCSQITHFGPLSARNATLTATRLKFLATALAAIVSKAPVSIRATLNARPVFARFDGVSAADGLALVTIMKSAFPSAQSAGVTIWRDTLAHAAADVAGSAVVV